MSSSNLAIHIPSPIQQIQCTELNQRGVELYVKREDLIHPLISGNKWRKLKYNLLNNPKGIITFGGAFSNHIHATAAAGQLYSINTIGIIRGEYDANNPTISACQAMGMNCYFVSRGTYRLKEKSKEIRTIIEKNPNYSVIPEGGSNDIAQTGLVELAEEITEDYDFIAVAAGTGATAKGIINNRHENILVFSALKGASLHDEFDIPASDKVEIIDEYHFGGYGKTNEVLIDFMNSFYKNHNIPIDPIYNGKVVYGLFDLIRKEKLTNCKILWIHTGGLQGIAAYNYMAAKKNKPLLNFNSNYPSSLR